MKSIISFFKFTPTEAAGIKPLVENHFLLFWLYNIMAVSYTHLTLPTKA